MAAPRAATTAAEAASNFARDGLFWMRDVLSPSEIDVLKSAAAENFAEIARTLLLQQALSAVTPTIKYAEVMARDGARFDCRQGANEEPMSTLLRPGGAASKLISVLQRVLSPDSSVVALGQIVACPHDSWADLMGDHLEDGNDDLAEFGVQRWHTDGPPSSFAGGPGDALTLFIPLVDLTLENGPTEYILGSHRDGEEAQAASGKRKSRSQTRRNVTILAPAGSVIAFDFKLLHRGLVNTLQSEDRPMLYAVVGKPIWTEDGRCMLPQLDGGGLSLFTGEAVPPIHERFVLGESVEASVARAAAESAAEEPAIEVTGRGGRKRGRR